MASAAADAQGDAAGPDAPAVVEPVPSPVSGEPLAPPASVLQSAPNLDTYAVAGGGRSRAARESAGAELVVPMPADALKRLLRFVPESLFTRKVAQHLLATASSVTADEMAMWAASDMLAAVLR
jgi:hypothetical protein